MPLPKNDRQFYSALTLGAQWLSVFGLFAALAGGIPPEINEAHYWTKAKHFWDPDWCKNDFFLQSSDAHLVFYLTFGQLTKFFALDLSVLVGRTITWAFLAAGWVYLSQTAIGNRKTFESSFWVVASAALFTFLTRNHDFGGEWVVGGVEAKGVAMALTLIALREFLHSKFLSTWVCLGLASAFHVLVGGWAVLALLIVIATNFLLNSLKSRSICFGRTWAWDTVGLVLGGLVALLGVVPGLLLQANQNSALNVEANQIYCLVRLPHHLLVSAIPGMSFVGFSILLLGLLIFFGIFLDRSVDEETAAQFGASQESGGFVWKLLQVSIASLLFWLIGSVLGLWLWKNGLTSSSVLLSVLKYYWFRCSDFLLPVTFSMLFLFWCCLLQGSGRRVVLGFLVGGVCLLTSIEFFQHWNPVDNGGKNRFILNPSDANFVRNIPGKKRRLDTAENWKLVCKWIRENTEKDALFLTPLHQNTFKWFAHRSEVVTWKDVPQDSKGLVQWHDRIKNLGPINRGLYGYYFTDLDKLKEKVDRFQVDYLVMFQYSYELGNQSGQPIPYQLVYPKDINKKTTFVVLKVAEE